MLATVTQGQNPAASYAPLVWLDGHCYLFLSELALHTRNLKRCSSISLVLIEAEEAAANPFARTASGFQFIQGLSAGGPLCARFWSGL